MSQPTSGRNHQGEQNRFQQSAPHGAQRGSTTPSPKSSTPWILAGVGIAVAAAAIGYMLWGSGGTTPIPATVLGESKDVAEAKIRSAGFKVAATPTYREDASKPDGVVLDTIPKPGTKLKADEEVTLVLNQIKTVTPPPVETVTIPAITPGTTYAAYRSKLEALGLKCQPESHDDPTHIIDDSNPKPGTKISKGESVTMMFSDTQPEKPVAKVEVPNLVGQEIAAAEKMLGDKSLKSSRIPETAGDSDKITKQIPEPGTMVDKDAIVSLVGTMTKPETDPAMPEIVGSSWTDAQTELATSGFDVSTVEKNSVFDESKAWDQVISSNPPKGVKVPKGTPIKVVVNDNYAVMLPGLRNTPFDAGIKDKLVAAGFDVTQNPSDSMIKDVKVGDKVARAGDRFEKGSKLNLSFETMSVADTINSVVRKPEQTAKDQIEAQITALSSTVKLLPIKFEPVKDEAWRGKVLSTKKDGIEVPDGTAVNLKESGDIELTVAKNPTKWKIKPTAVKKLNAGDPKRLLAPVSNGIVVTPKVKGTADPSATKYLDSSFPEVDETKDVSILEDLEIEVQPENYVVGELTFSVEISFKDLNDSAGETFSATTDLKIDLSTNPAAVEVELKGDKGNTVWIVFDAPKPVYE